MKPITYPARPVNGGPLPKARAKMGTWIYEPKYNGWRALVHVPTRTMFNRHGQPISIAAEFRQALDQLCQVLDAGAFHWVDCEALERRHGIGRGCLIVLDVVPEPEFANTPFDQRRAWLRIPKTSLPTLGVLERPSDGHIYLASHEGATGPDALWLTLQNRNRELGCEFYEGLVAKRVDSPYPIQLRSASEEFPGWMKHRWQF